MIHQESVMTIKCMYHSVMSKSHSYICMYTHIPVISTCIDQICQNHSQ